MEDLRTKLPKGGYPSDWGSHNHNIYAPKLKYNTTNGAYSIDSGKKIYRNKLTLKIIQLLFPSTLLYWLQLLLAQTKRRLFFKHRILKSEKVKNISDRKLFSHGVALHLKMEMSYSSN